MTLHHPQINTKQSMACRVSPKQYRDTNRYRVFVRFLKRILWPKWFLINITKRTKSKIWFLYLLLLVWEKPFARVMTCQKFRGPNLVKLVSHSSIVNPNEISSYKSNTNKWRSQKTVLVAVPAFWSLYSSEKNFPRANSHINWTNMRQIS